MSGVKSNWIIALFFTICYWAIFPKAFLISDEWGYTGRALAMLSGDKSLIFNDLETGFQQDVLARLSYPLGTSYLAALVIFVGGKKMCFLVGFFSLLFSQLLMSKMVLKLSGSSVVTLLTWCCVPCLVVSRTVMSDTPALLLSALFFYYYFNDWKTIKYYCLLGFIGGLSFLFRENLIVLVAFFLLKSFYDGNLKQRLCLILGFSLGIGIRLLSAYYFYNDPLYYKLMMPFGARFFTPNGLFYGISLITVFPLAAFVVIAYRGKEQGVLKLTVLANFLFFSFYAYTGSISGFLRSIILANRFLIPLLPLFMVAYAAYWQKISISSQRIIHKILFVFSFPIVLIIQIVTHYFEQQNSGVIDCTKNSPTLIISSNITHAKYINAITSDSRLISREACENNPKIIQRVISEQGYCDLFELDRKLHIDSTRLKQLFKQEEICSFSTSDGFTGRVIRLK